MTHATRRFILGVIIVLNTVLFGMNLFIQRDFAAGMLNLLACCVAWVGVYFVNWAERVELRDNGDDDDDE